MLSKFQTKLYLGNSKLRSGIYIISATQYAKYTGGPQALRNHFVCKTKPEALKLFKALKEDRENEWAEVWLDRYEKGTKRANVTGERAHFSDPHNLLN